jgi:TetR/AcrR family transcriptional repressor of nem operon
MASNGGMARKATATADTPQRVLDVAERLVQTRGFNGFSYADIADALGITKASLHYHFPTKAELGRRLIERYESRFLEALAAIDGSGGDAREKLRRYAEIYVGVLRANRMCLCGMLASDYATLAKPVKDGVKHFFDSNEEWLVAVLEAGRKAGTLRFAGEPAVVAQALVGSLEGAMMLARSYGDVARFETVATRLIAEL